MRTPSVILGTALIAGLTALSGCAPSSSDLQQLNQNQFVLRGMIASDRQQIDAIQQQVRRLQDELSQVQHSGAGPSVSGGQVASLNKRLSKLESEVGALQAAMPTIPPALGPAPGSTGTAAPTTGATTPAAPMAGITAPLPPPASPFELQPTWPRELEQELAATKDRREAGVTLYRDALTDMKSGRYPAAVLKFARLQRKYPKSPFSEASDYFAANALYEDGKYDRAILQFNDLVMRFPRGKYASQSLLREAQAFMKLNDKIDARLTLQKLLSDHPGTPQATAANTLMKRLTASAD